MIFNLFNLLKERHIEFCLVNGYADVVSQSYTDSDIDILFRKNDFEEIETTIQDFCNLYKLQKVQMLHHELLAKNIFLYNPKDEEYLNLDLYGELSRKGILLCKEEVIFNSLGFYKAIPILSPDKEFINYLIKKLDKDDLTQETFSHLRSLYIKDTKLCKKGLMQFFPSQYLQIQNIFLKDNFTELNKSRNLWINEFYNIKSFDLKRIFLNSLRTVKRVIYPTGLTISFLGPDGSGKSTIINELLATKLPFRRKDYFHLKPTNNKTSSVNNVMITDPHKYSPYSKPKSYFKLAYFLAQYNLGWIKNIYPLKIKSSLVIFDRYFDDILVDYKRYRYGGNKGLAKFTRLFIPKPDLYFILTTDAKVIFERKQEVPFEELERQIKGYESLADGKQYFSIDVSRSPHEITKEIMTVMMEKMSERY